ncbi:SET and MYND domain-containing protein 4-like isoform X2 [Macrobrachium nipponense]|uniref:SET and MYND domain-containing protein 4-like isoform X2 n=1 Tax=Macrobrachium nipponense TaxID=159736 RepID=UPI0030C7CA29
MKRFKRDKMHAKASFSKTLRASRHAYASHSASPLLPPVPETPPLLSAQSTLKASPPRKPENASGAIWSTPSFQANKCDVKHWKTSYEAIPSHSPDDDASGETDKQEQCSFISSFCHDIKPSYPVEMHEVPGGAHRLCSNGLRSVDIIKENFKKNISDKRYTEIESHFTAERSEEDLFTTIWNIKECHDYLGHPQFFSSKSEEDFAYFLIQADIVRDSNPKLAMYYYNHAVLSAPNPLGTIASDYRKRCVALKNVKRIQGNELSKVDLRNLENLSKCYASRSDCLLAMKEYEKCLTDLNLATIYGSSEGNSKEEIESKRMECVEFLKRTKSNIMFQSSAAKLTFTNLIERLNKCLVTREQKLLADLLSSPLQNEIIKARRDVHVSGIQAELRSCNATLPKLSSSVGLACNSIKGRSIIAQNDITPGDVLAIDSCYVSTLYNCNQNIFCYACFARCLAVHPCPSCAKNNSVDHAISSLACKILLKEGFPHLSKIISKLKREEKELSPILRGYNEEGKFTSEDFENVYHMVNHKENLSNSEIFDKCITAFLLLKALIASQTFFCDLNGVMFIPSSRDINMAGTILLRLLLSLPFSAQEIARYEISDAEDETLPVTVLGAGVFPTLSLINHSCNPTALAYFDGKMMFLRAITFISMGEEITYNYIGNYGEATLNVRKARLVKYFVNCRCEACNENWPLFSDLANLQIPCLNCHSAVPLTEINPVCPQCELKYKPNIRSQATWWKTIAGIKIARERYKFVVMKLTLNKPLSKQDYSAVTNYVKVLKKKSSLPNKQYYCAQHFLQRLFVRHL